MRYAQTQAVTTERRLRRPDRKSTWTAPHGALALAANWRALYLDSLFEAEVVHLARHHSTLAECDTPARYALAPARLRRVLDHVEGNIEEKLTSPSWLRWRA